MYPAIFENRDFSVLAFCPHVNGAAGTINTVFQKRSQNGVLRASSLIHRLIVDRRKTEVFEFDDIILPSF